MEKVYTADELSAITTECIDMTIDAFENLAKDLRAAKTKSTAKTANKKPVAKAAAKKTVSKKK